MAQRSTAGAGTAGAQRQRASVRGRPARDHDDPPDGPTPVNEVHLVGRVAAAGESRTLPSGDAVTVLRVVVARPETSRRGPRTPTVDTVECAIWTARLRQRAVALPAGTMVEIDGALRRRFWRTPGGPASRYEVEVTSLRRA
jgi:single-strand DNA-binding protein